MDIYNPARYRTVIARVDDEKGNNRTVIKVTDMVLKEDLAYFDTDEEALKYLEDFRRNLEIEKILGL